MDRSISFTVSRRTIRLALALAVVVAVLAPVAVIAAGGTFTDDDSSIFEGNIEWMAANGITSGCGPGLYCPEDNVTRGEMAAFMERLATKKVVEAATAEDASTVGGLTAAELMANSPIGVGFYDRATLFGTGVTGVTSPKTGVYCVTMDPALGLSRSDVVVQAAAEWGSSSGYDLFAYWDVYAGDCEDGQFSIRTYQFSYDGDFDVSDVELNGDVAWTYTMYHRPPAGRPLAAAEGELLSNANR